MSRTSPRSEPPSPEPARLAALEALLESYARIAIVGGPRTGKTVLAAQVGARRPLIHTDDLRHLPWPDVPAAIMAACRPLEAFVVEGVQVARALRAGLEIDAVLYLDDHHDTRSKGQQAMGKGVTSIFAQWRSVHPEVHVVSPDLSS